MTSVQDLARPTSGNVVDLILDDHRRFEDLLREVRSAHGDDRQALEAFATLHLAHARAEETEVYPALRKQDAVDSEEADHGKEEHAEGHEALLAVLELDRLEGEEFEERIERLGELVNHHLGEEEINILTPARQDAAEELLADLGERFARARNEALDEGPVGAEEIRRVVEASRREGLLDD